MDLRSEDTIKRKKEELRIARGKIVEKRREADFKRLESERKQREEEMRKQIRLKRIAID